MAVKVDDASAAIDALIARTDDWRGKLLADIRKAVLGVSPDIVETFKWMGTPTWESDGAFAIANPHKGKVKVTFAHGASLDDPMGCSTMASTAMSGARSTLSRAISCGCGRSKSL